MTDVDPFICRDRLDVQNHGSVLLISGMDAEAQAALERGAPDDAQWWCGGLAVEPRYLLEVIEWVTVELNGGSE